MRTYLSIDLDFWNDRPSEECLKFMQKVRATGLPIKIVDDHADLLPFINKAHCDCIINLDYHSDISNNETGKSGKHTIFEKKYVERGFVKKDKYFIPKLNCGTWANWVENKDTFIWLHPFNVRLDLALCHDPRRDEYSPFCNPNLAGYRKVSKLSLHHLPCWIFNDVVEIGIACSYKWLEENWETERVDQNHPLELVTIIKNVFGNLPTNKEEFNFLLKPEDLGGDLGAKMVIEINEK